MRLWTYVFRLRFFAVALGSLNPCISLAASPDLTVEKPWVRYLLPNLPAAGYLVLHNAGDSTVTLTAAASPDCGMLMLHESQDDSGMAMMTDVHSLVVPAHGSVAFAPGGYHLMCMQPKMTVGEKIPVTLRFQDGSVVMLLMPVYGAQNGP